MKTLILACNTIRDELEKAARETGCIHPFTWIESGQHLVPESLRRRIQEELDHISGVDQVLLGFGYCGNAVLGLEARDFRLIIPKVDDCITWLLGSEERRELCGREGGVYFLTKGWLEGEVNIWKEYQSVLSRFGQERTEQIYRRMLAHYRFLGLIDTGAYDAAALFPHVSQVASTLELEAKILSGSDLYLKKFLTGPWDEKDFLILTPMTRLGLGHLPGIRELQEHDKVNR